MQQDYLKKTVWPFDPTFGADSVSAGYHVAAWVVSFNLICNDHILKSIILALAHPPEVHPGIGPRHLD